MVRGKTVERCCGSVQRKSGKVCRNGARFRRGMNGNSRGEQVASGLPDVCVGRPAEKCEGGIGELGRFELNRFEEQAGDVLGSVGLPVLAGELEVFEILLGVPQPFQLNRGQWFVGSKSCPG